MAAVGTVQYRFDSTPFSGDQVDVLSVRWREALNAPYRAEIEIALVGADEDPLLLLGADGVLTLSRQSLQRRLTGVITEVEHLEPRTTDHTHVRVWLEPAFALLDLSQWSRISQEKKVSDILDSVLSEALGAYGREAQLSLDGTYPTREYCVQYRESDRAFVERLTEKEGISYAFDHDGSVEVMVLRDRNSFPTASTANSTVPFNPRVGAELEADEVIYELWLVPSVTTTKVTIRDHDWTAPSTPREAASGEDPRESYEFGLGRYLTISDYSGTAYGAHDADRQAALRLEALMRDANVIEGSSRVIGLMPGTTITIVGHSADVDGEYLVTEVEHLSAGTDHDKDPYANRFRCIPNATAYRPARLREKPSVPSVQTAIVTGPSGEEIHTDEHGRIKAQFHWDLVAPGDETSSCWLRVQQPWAGSSWGFVFLPRVGMEVAVHFLNGDPDRPVVHGCLYNSEHHPPYALPAEKTKSTIKSNSSPGGGGFNEIRIEDLAGSEQIYIHAQKDLDEDTKWDHSGQINVDESTKVGNNQTQHVIGHQTEQIDGKQTMTVDGNRDVKVTGKFTETVLSGEKRALSGANEELILSGGEGRTVVGGLDETLNATEVRAIIGGQKETHIGGVTHKVESSHTDTVMGVINQMSHGYNLKSGATMLIEAASLNNVLAAGMTINATTATMDSSFHLQIDPNWFGASGTSDGKYGGCAISLAGVSLAATGASASATCISISGTGNASSVNGLKASATAVSVTFGTKKSQDLAVPSFRPWIFL